MMDLYSNTDYREALTQKIEEYPHQGHGKKSELSRYLGVHTTLVSQVLKGHKDLSIDQILLAAKFFSLSELETEYLSTLLMYNRSANQTSKKFFDEKLKAIRKKAQSISQRVKKDFELSEEVKAIYYSDWCYAAICQAVALDEIRNADDISISLNLNREQVANKLEFLLECGLIIKENNNLTNGVNSLHLAKTSPWIKSHHMNWRQKAIESLNDNDDKALHYSCPLTISTNDAEKIHKLILSFIEQMREVVDPSPCEEFYCLNIDWFLPGNNKTKRCH